MKRAAGEAFQFLFPRCSWFGNGSITIFACLKKIERIEDVCIRLYFSIAMMKIKLKTNKMIWNIPRALLVISVFLSSVGLLEGWNVLDSADWKLNFGSGVSGHLPLTVVYTTKNHDFCFFFNSLHGLFGSSSSAVAPRWRKFSWDVEFVLGVKIWAAETWERARCRLSASAPEQSLHF